MSLHEGVQEAAVIGVPDEQWGERPLALIVPTEPTGGRMTGEAMQEHLGGYVDDGTIAKWAVPEHYVFTDELPRTSVGKIDKKALREKFG